jgi:asparagine synthetase A
LKYKELGQQVEALGAQLTPAFVEHAVNILMRQGEDVGGGINAHRLVRHLLGSPQLGDVEAVWAYDRLKPAFRAAFAHIPSLYYFEGD